MINLLRENEIIAKNEYEGNSDLAYIKNQKCKENISKFIQLRNQIFKRYKKEEDEVKKKNKNNEIGFNYIDVFYNILHLDPSMLDSTINNDSLTKIKDFSGPKGNRMPFKKPENFTLYGINIKTKKWDPIKDINIFANDNRNDEWWIGYYGLEDPKILKDILENGFLSEKINAPVDKKELQWSLDIEGKPVQNGPFFTPFPEYAEYFGERRGGLNYKEQSYIFLLLCRINPKAIKEKGKVEEWNITKDDDIIRPFGILVKKNEYKYKLSNFKEKFEYYKNIHKKMDDISWDNPEKNLPK